MFPRISIFLLFIIALQGCKQDSPENSSEPVKELPPARLSFDVNDYRRYPIPDTISRETFIFSPIDPKDKIWTESHELDLSTGEWIPLKKKFGIPNPVWATEKNVWIDSLTSNVYITSFYQGLIEYNAQQKTFKTLELRGVSSFLARKNFIFLGTSRGLYKYSRTTDRIERAANFPDSLWVSDIKMISDDCFRVRTHDHDFIYCISNSRLTKAGEIPIPTDDVYEMSGLLPQRPGSYQAIKDDRLIWLYNQSDVYVKDGDSFFHFTKLDSGFIQQIRVDAKYLYLLYSHQVLILNKEFVIRNVELFDYQAYQNELKDIYAQPFYELTLQQMISRVDTLHKRYGHSRFPDIRSRVMELNDVVGSSLSNERFRLDVEKAIQNKSLPEKFKKSALTGLIVHYTRQCNLNKSLDYYKQLQKTFTVDQGLAERMRYISDVKTRMDSIDRLPIEGDQKLYLHILQREKLIQCGWFGESYIDNTIVAESYKKLLDTYPNSEFADNAAYFFIYRTYNDGEDGLWYSPEAVQAYDRFVEQYPHSEFKVNAALNIIQMSVYFSGEPKDHLAILENALARISRLESQTMAEEQKAWLLSSKSEIASKIAKYKNQTGR